jgi:hypothetical protein
MRNVGNLCDQLILVVRGRSYGNLDALSVNVVNEKLLAKLVDAVRAMVSFALNLAMRTFLHDNELHTPKLRHE